MDAHEVVMKIVNRKGSFKASELLGKGVRQAGKPAHLHPNGQVLPFHKAGGDVLSGRIARNRSDFDADDTARRVTMLALKVLG